MFVRVISKQCNNNIVRNVGLKTAINQADLYSLEPWQEMRNWKRSRDNEPILLYTDHFDKPSLLKRILELET